MNKKEKKIIRVANYARVSTGMQVKDGDSIREQLDTNNNFIDSHEKYVLYDTYIDGGTSGTKIERDDFQRLIRDVQAGNIDLIVFTKMDRWFRSLKHYLNTQDILDQHGVSWIASREPYYDTTTPHGRAFINQSMSFAQLESENDSERIRAVFENKVKNGEVISGVVPTGFRIENKHLVHSDQAPMMHDLFHHYRNDPNLRGLMRYAADEYNFLRSYTTFRRMLQNEKYKGVYKGNNKYCPAIVPPELFDDVNRLISRNQKQNKRHDYIFSGLLVCGNCGRKLNACTIKQHKTKIHDNTIGPDGRKNRYRYPAYRCYGYANTPKKSKACINRKQFYETTLERRILEMLKPALKKYIADYDVSMAPVVNLSNKRKNIENKISKLKDLYLNDLISLDEFKIDKAHFEEMLDDLPMQEVVEKDLTTAKKLLDMDIESFYSTMTVLEKKQFYYSFIDKIIIDNDKNIKIEFL